LEFRRRRELEAPEALVCFDLLFGIVLPLYVTLPAFSFILDVEVVIIRTDDLLGVGGFQFFRVYVQLDGTALVADAEASCLEALFKLPLIRALQVLSALGGQGRYLDAIVPAHEDKTRDGRECQAACCKANLIHQKQK